MPFSTSFSQLPCGERYLRLETSGHFSREDAEALIRRVNPGGDLHRIPALILTEKLKSFGSEARALFAERGDTVEKDSWVAVVVANPVIRIGLNFLKRVQGATNGMLFSNEPAALQWLDAQVREDLAGRAGTVRHR